MVNNGRLRTCIYRLPLLFLYLCLKFSGYFITYENRYFHNHKITENLTYVKMFLKEIIIPCAPDLVLKPDNLSSRDAIQIVADAVTKLVNISQCSVREKMGRSIEVLLDS
jgi:hypothetical protein